MEKVFYHKPENLPGVEILSVQSSSRCWRVYHETYTVCAIMPCQSRAEWLYRRRFHGAMTGQLMAMEPGEVHDTKRMIGKGNFEVLWMQPSLVKDVARELGAGQTPHLAQAEISSPLLYNSFLRLCSSFGKRGGLLEQESRLTNYIALLLDRCGEKRSLVPATPTAQVLKLAASFIRDHWMEKIGLDQLAGISGLSRFHFLRSFTRLFGIPPHAYQTQVRIAKARTLLARGVSSAGLDVGFADQSHFIRHFKGVVGVTPGRYADMVRKPFSGATGVPG